jgi:hypothetical protein
VDGETSYARCANTHCAYFGFSFAPPPKPDKVRCCPSCETELEKWKDSDERRERLEGERADDADAEAS